MSIILQVSPDIKGAANVRRRLKQRMIEWEESKFQMVISSTVMSAAAKMDHKRESIKIKEKAKVFSSVIYRGEIRASVQYACEREKGCILIP